MAARPLRPSRLGPGRAGLHLLGWLAMVALVACEPNVPGIYHTLATESERDNRNLDDNLTVSATAEWAGNYYVAAHGLWSRPTGRDSWQQVRRPPPGSVELPVLAMAQSGGTLCVGTESGVYHAAANPESPSWQQAAGISGQILRLFAIPGGDGEILAIVHGDGLYVSDDCRDFDPVPLPDATSGRPYDAFHDGVNYWLTVGGRIYSGTDLRTLEREAGAPEQSDYRGIWCLEAGNCYIANRDGEIYNSQARYNWEPLEQIEPPDDDASAVPLTLFIAIDGQILIGTEGYGFYQFGVQDRDLSNVRRGPRSTSQLYRAHITVFARHGGLVFAGTAGGGLSSIEIATAVKDTGTWDWE